MTVRAIVAAVIVAAAIWFIIHLIGAAGEAAEVLGRIYEQQP